MVQGIQKHMANRNDNLLQFVPNKEYIEIVDVSTNLTIGEIFFNADIAQFCHYPYDVLTEQHLQQVLAYMETLS